MHDLKVVGIMDWTIDYFEGCPVKRRVAPHAKHLGTPTRPENGNGALGAIFGVAFQEGYRVDVGLKALVILRLPDDSAVQASCLFAESALVVTRQKAVARLGCALFHKGPSGILRVLVIVDQKNIFVHFKVGDDGFSLGDFVLQAPQFQGVICLGNHIGQTLALLLQFDVSQVVLVLASEVVGQLFQQDFNGKDAATVSVHAGRLQRVEHVGPHTDFAADELASRADELPGRAHCCNADGAFLFLTASSARHAVIFLLKVYNLL